MGLFSTLNDIGQNASGVNGLRDFLDPAGFFSSSNDAAAAAARAQRQRQKQRRDAAQRVNDIFATREPQYHDVANATEQYFEDLVNRRHDQAQRQLKFHLAAAGQTGGSVAADQNERLGEDYSAALLNAARQGVQAGQNLRQQDEALREQLLANINAGTNATADTSHALEAARANFANARNPVGTLGNIFGDVASVWQRRQQEQQYQQGWQDFLNRLYGGQA